MDMNFKKNINITTILWGIIVSYLCVDSIIFQTSFRIKIIILIGMMVLLGITCSKKMNISQSEIKDNKLACLFVILLGIGFLLAGIKLNVIGYIAYFVAFGMVLPWLYIRNVNYTLVITSLVSATIYLNVLFILISFLIAPLNQGLQYEAFVGNANSLGLIISFFTICNICFIFYVLDSSKHRKIICKINLIFNGAFLLLSESRTAFLAVVFCILVLLFDIIKKGKATIKKIVLSGLLLFLTILISFNVSVMWLTHVTPLLLDGIEDYIGVSLFEDEELENIHLDGNINVESGRPNGQITLNDTSRFEHFMKKMTKGLGSTGRFSSGRAEIWINFISELNIIGHSSETLIIETNTDGTMERDAHNSTLQIWYSAGLFAGFVFFSITILMIRYVARCILGNKVHNNELETNFGVMLFGSYVIFSMLSAMYSFTHDILAFCIWVFLPLIFTIKKRNKNEEHF